MSLHAVPKHASQLTGVLTDAALRSQQAQPWRQGHGSLHGKGALNRHQLAGFDTQALTRLCCARAQGKLTNGKVFDSSVAKQRPFCFTVGTGQASAHAWRHRHRHCS